jgi:DNA-binding NarL/FixJ family response regulator
MENLPVVILLDNNTLVRNRIKAILSDQNVAIYEAFNRKDLSLILVEKHYKIDLIITDIEIDPKNSFDAVSLTRLVKSKNNIIPVVVISSTSSEEIITGLLYEGVSDYILKPFEDDYIKSKLLKYVNIESLTEYTVLKFNLSNFLASEIHKAKKGNYFFSLLVIKFHVAEEENSDMAGGGLCKYSETVYNEIKSLFWESDLYIQHSLKSHLGFFPFCNQENTRVIIEKILAKFEGFKRTDSKMCNCSISHTFSTYPTDGETISEILKALESDRL